MEPLVVLIVVTLVLLGLGAVGVRSLRPWPVALRGGLAAMFVLTGLAHFDLPAGMRAQLIEMVPPGLPDAALLVTITGVLELAGAAGLLWTRTSPWAAAGLSALLIAMFPANVYKALTDPTLGFDDQLLPRTALQVIFLAATLAVLAHHLRSRRLDSRVDDAARTPTFAGRA